MTFDRPGNQPQRGGEHHSAAQGGCPTFDQLSAFADQELGEREMREIRAHVATCQACAEALADIRRLSAALRHDAHIAVPRAFTLTDDMIASRRLAPVTPIEQARRRVPTTWLLPVATAVAALLLIAVIAGDAWSGGNSTTPTPDSAQVIIIDGTAIPVDDAELNAAGAGTINNGNDSANAAANDDDFDWVNWWRLPEGLLALTALVLIVTMVRRRRAQLG